MIHPSRRSRTESRESRAGSGNGSNHGRIRVELSRRRVIIVNWHHSVVSCPPFLIPSPPPPSLDGEGATMRARPDLTMKMRFAERR